MQCRVCSWQMPMASLNNVSENLFALNEDQIDNRQTDTFHTQVSAERGEPSVSSITSYVLAIRTR